MLSSPKDATIGFHLFKPPSLIRLWPFSRVHTGMAPRRATPCGEDIQVWIGTVLVKVWQRQNRASGYSEGKSLRTEAASQVPALDGIIKAQKTTGHQRSILTTLQHLAAAAQFTKRQPLERPGMCGFVWWHWGEEKDRFGKHCQASRSFLETVFQLFYFQAFNLSCRILKGFHQRPSVSSVFSYFNMAIHLLIQMCFYNNFCCFA